MTWLDTLFMSGDDIYRNFHAGPGVRDMSTGAHMVQQVAERQSRRADAINRLAAKMETAWEGAAAGAAQRGAAPLAAEHTVMPTHLDTAQDLVRRQVGSYETARNTVVPVPPQPQVPGWPALAAFRTPLPSYQQQLAAHHQANQVNVDAMTVYEGASQYNTDTLPTTYGALSAEGPSRTSQPSAGAIGGVPVTLGTSGPSTTDTTVPSAQDPVPGRRSAVADSQRQARVTAPSSEAPASGGPGSAVQRPGSTTTPERAALPGTLDPARGGSGNTSGGALSGTPGHHGTGDGHGLGVGARTGTAPIGTAMTEVAGASTGRGAGRGPAGAPLGMSGGRAGRGEDKDRERQSFLVEDDPEDLFGTDEVTAPPVIE